ncbi:MAG: GFA family protein [Pseudomonadota bacterium]
MIARSFASCHCGTVRISFVMVDGLEGLHRCDCSLCRRKYPGAVSGLVQDLKVEQGAEHLGLYQFGTMTARHQFCKICGVHVFHQRRSDPREIGVNVGCVEGLDPRVAERASWVDGVVHPSDAV